MVSATATKSPRETRNGVQGDDILMLRPAVGSTADGTRRSTGPETADTQKMGESAGTGEALAYAIARDPPPPAPLAMGWPTVAVGYHYSDQRTTHRENEPLVRSRTLANLYLALVTM